MNDTEYRRVLASIKADLVATEEEHGKNLARAEALEKRIAYLRETAVAMARVVGEEFNPMDEIGLTDAVRAAFRGATAPMAPNDVREKLRQLGYDLTKYGNVLASLSTVTNRLFAAGEIKEAGQRSNGQRVYVCVSNVISPPPGFTGPGTYVDVSPKK